MGGKKGQRTKGNTRPSSSGRTALLLPENVVNKPFIGFSAFKEANSSEQTTVDSKCEEFDLSSDSDLCLVLKKMQKKDNVTKIKALQEFSELCESKDKEVVKALLPLWPKFFNKLSLDIDWKVREAVHKAMKHLLRRVEREIAPFLKQLMPIWLISFFDPYPPAASAAISSFNVAFPNVKQKEVFIFTKVEVIAFCKENLLKIELKDVVSPESEVDNREYILLNSSLRVFSLLLLKFDVETSIEFMTPLLDNDKFWKFCNHKNPEIRLSWFKLKSTICEVLPDTLKLYSVKACRTTLNHLTDSDPNVCSAIWENCSLIIKLIQDWWNHINLSNSFRPQLFCAMRKKSNSFIFAHLLVILKHLPTHAFQDNFKFVREFLDTFEESLQINGKFPSDFSCAVVAYFECVKYLTTNSDLLSDSERTTIFEHVLNKQIKPMLNRFLQDCNARKRNTVYYVELAKYVESLDGSKQQNDLMHCITEVCLNATQNAFNSKSESLLGLTHFIQELTAEKCKPLRRVQFDDNSVNDSFSTLKIDRQSESKASKTFEHILSLLIEQVLKSIETHSFDVRWLKFCYELSNIGDCFSFLLSKQKMSVEAFLQRYLKDDSLKNMEMEIQQQQIELSINLLFKICVISEAKVQSLNELIGFNDPLILEKVVKNIKLYSNDPFFLDWLKSETAVEYVLTIAKELVKRIHNKDDSMMFELNALWNSLTIICTLEPMNKAWLNEVILLFHETIRENNSNPSNDIIDFVCDVFEKIFFIYKPCYTLTSMNNLLLTFFKLSCHQSEKRRKLFSAWTQGVEMVCKNCAIDTAQNLLSLIVAELHRLLCGNISSKEKAVIITDNIFELLKIVDRISCEDGKAGKAISVDLMLNSILLSFDEWTQLMSVVNNDFLYPLWFDGILIPQQSYTENIEGKQVTSPFVFTAAVIINVLNSSRPHVDATKNIPYLFNHLFSYVSFSYCKQMSSFLAYKETESIHEVFKLMENSCNELITYYSNYVKDEVVPQLYQLSLSKGSVFGVALRHVLDIPSESQLPESCVPVSQNFNFESIATMQLISCHLKKQHLFDLYTTLLYQLLSSDSIYEINSGLGCLALIHSLLQLNIDINFEEHVYPFLEYFVGFKEQQPTLYSYQKNDIYLQFASVLAGVFECVFNRWNDCITSNQKDLIFCSVTSWITNFCAEKDLLVNNSLLIFAYRALQLLKSISNMCKEQSTSEEWVNFHSKKINKSLFSFFCSVESGNCSPQTHHFLCILSDILILNASNVLSDTGTLSVDLQEKACSAQIIVDKKCLGFKVPSQENILLSNLSPLMNSQERPVYRTAHCLIMKILPAIASNLEVDNVEDEDCYLTPPMCILSILHQTDQIVEAMLSDFRVGDCCCVVDETTDAYHYTVCFLLSWMQVLEYLANLSAENRSLLSNYLRESGLFFKMVNNLFRLLPINEINNDKIQEMVVKPLHFNVHSVPSSIEVQHIACQLYILTLKTMPATVRLWIGSQEKRIVEAVNDFTTVNVSQHMSAEEFKAIQIANLSTFKNMSIKSRPAAREIYAVYAIEDMLIELTIKFPANHPINPVTIDGGKRVGVSPSQWRTWLLQLTTFLTHQNGSIVDGLLLWKKNIDKRFEGVEECMICFYILHGSTCQLPKLSCKHCKKKYHPACLFKWFKTSNNATCPLCRNLFDTKL